MKISSRLRELTSLVTDHLASLETWEWLLPGPARPVLVTKLGDVVLVGEDGEVWLLDSTSAELFVVAEDEASAAAVLDSEEGRDELLKEPLYRELRRAHPAPGEGKCYSQVQPAVLGGSFEASNYEVGDVEVHLGLLGQIHEQVKDLPEGTPIGKIEIK